MTWYQVNWIKTPKGNAINEGSKLTIKINKPNVDHISFGIYQNGFPVLAGFGKGNTASILVQRKGKNLSGAATLKVRGYTKDYKGFGIDDAFIII